MSTPGKRHIYYDQQIPQEEPQDAEHATVRQNRFARRNPTLEDDYFFREESRAALLSEPAEASPAKPEVLADQASSIWQRIYRVFARTSDPGWRP
jgi:hypothetical protein